MISYSLNWMGPINKDWLNSYGDCWSAGRIDIRDDSKQGYDGWDEYAIPPMRNEDWNDLGDYLWDLETTHLLTKEELIASFEKVIGRKVRWCL